MNLSGNFKFIVPGTAFLTDDDKTLVIAIGTRDKAGNPTFISENKVYKVYMKKPKTSIVIDNITADNIISAVEARTEITVTGKVIGDYNVGKLVSIYVNNKEFITQVDANGNFSEKIPNIL